MTYRLVYGMLLWRGKMNLLTYKSEMGSRCGGVYDIYLPPYSRGCYDTYFKLCDITYSARSATYHLR